MKTKLGAWFLRWFAGGIMREIVEGKRGPTLQNLYLKLVGWKSTTGWMLAILLAALYALDPELASELAPGLGTIAGLFISWGWLDKEWRQSQPPEWVGEGLRTLLSLGPLLSAVVAIAVTHLKPSWGERVELAAASVAMATAWLAARVSPPPLLPLIPKPKVHGA